MRFYLMLNNFSHVLPVRHGAVRPVADVDHLYHAHQHVRRQRSRNHDACMGMYPLSPVYTIQPVVKRLSIRFDNRCIV